MRILVYAYRDWSFMNIEPVIKHYDYDRYYAELNIELDITKYDLVIICEPNIKGWRELYPLIKGKIPILSMQQGLYWDNIANPHATFRYDKIMVWGEQFKEVCILDGLSSDRIIVTGNPRFDKYFNVPINDEGYTLILGGQCEHRNEIFPKVTGKEIFTCHPHMTEYKITTNTDKLVRNASRVIFRRTGAGILAMIMNKPSIIIPFEDKKKYHKSRLYDSTIYGTDPEYVRWAVGGPGAGERVRKVIDSYAPIPSTY